ncbi:MAG: hypothetical protein F6K19_44560 [Cyanothece sp. SIO1E1]|nr:hypothetical protein [Cyanothece sp. SIO1E1]
MRYFLLSFMLIGLFCQLQAQSKLNLFLSPNTSVGNNKNTAQILPSSGLRWETDPAFFNTFEDGKSRTPFHLKVGVEGGVSWKERFFLFTGFTYTLRFDEGYPSCDFCDMAPPEFTTSLHYKFLEIPIGFNVLLTKDRRVDPFIGASIFYTLPAGDHPYRSWAWQYRAGTSMPVSENWSIQTALYMQGNPNVQEQPYYIFREFGLQVSFLKVFRGARDK